MASQANDRFWSEGIIGRAKFATPHRLMGQGGPRSVSGNPAHSLTARAAADVRRLPAIRGPPGGAAPPWRRHPRERDRRKGKEQNPFTRIGTSTPGQLQWEPGREPKMGALEELYGSPEISGHECRFDLGHVIGASYRMGEAGAQGTAQSERIRPWLVANRFQAISQASMMSARLINTVLASQWLRR